MDFKDIIKTLAPTVASAMLGPLGGVAVAALGSIMGIDAPTQDKIKDAITNGQMTPEQVAQIKALELQFQNDEKERGFRYAELEFKDRDSARKRETDTGDLTNRRLAFIIVCAFIAMVGCTLAGWAKVDSVLAGTLIGYLSAKCEQVLAYYFGSSQGSKDKTALLAQAQPIK
jgi:hypothetical protein